MSREPAQPAPPAADRPFLDRVARQHRANFDLWHIEDEARAPGASDAELAGVKRRIDRTNQLRNDLAEELDRHSSPGLHPRPCPAPAHRSTPSRPASSSTASPSLPSRFSTPAKRPSVPSAPAGHAERNRDRLAILQEQRADLAACLDALWRETLAGTRRFKLYRQLKMYNDPSLNPAIYRKSTREPTP